jgi:hypothetical protein
MLGSQTILLPALRAANTDHPGGLDEDYAFAVCPTRAASAITRSTSDPAFLAWLHIREPGFGLIWRRHPTRAASARVNSRNQLQHFAFTGQPERRCPACLQIGHQQTGKFRHKNSIHVRQRHLHLLRQAQRIWSDDRTGTAIAENGHDRPAPPMSCREGSIADGEFPARRIAWIQRLSLTGNAAFCCYI